MEERKKSAKWSKILWIIYVCFLFFIGVLALFRLISLCRRVTWRKDLNSEFPSECGDWAAENGCTRVSLSKAGCVRTNNISTENSVIFNVDVDRLLNTQISQCVDQEKGAKLMHPSNLKELNTHGDLIHITFNSAIFGFIDDMYMIT